MTGNKWLISDRVNAPTIIFSTSKRNQYKLLQYTKIDFNVSWQHRKKLQGNLAECKLMVEKEKTIGVVLITYQYRALQLHYFMNKNTEYYVFIMYTKHHISHTKIHIFL